MPQLPSPHAHGPTVGSLAWRRAHHLQARLPAARTCRRAASASTRTAATSEFAAFIPQPEAAAIEEPAAKKALASLARTMVTIPSVGEVETAFLANEAVGATKNADLPPVVALHGFDSSCLEFRRLLPRLGAAGVPAYAVDLVGWGFTDHSPFVGSDAAALGPTQKREHLYEFWRAKVRGGEMRGER